MKKAGVLIISALFFLPNAINALTPTLTPTPLDYTTSDLGPLGVLALICPLASIGTFSVVMIYMELIACLFSLAAFVLWVWMLIDVLQRDNKDFPQNSSIDPKLLWVLVILLTGSVGALIYYILVYRQNSSKPKLIAK